jgi:hemoglobin
MAQGEQAQDQPSLYPRLGGVYSIATVVDDLIDRVMSDPRLNANPRVDEAHHRVPPAGFKYLVTEMLCWAAGGPQSYSGRAMEESHSHLRITPGEWQAFLDDLQQTLDKVRGARTGAGRDQGARRRHAERDRRGLTSISRPSQAGRGFRT